MATIEAAPLLEREGELAELRAVFEASHAGHGRLAVVEGAAGSGKSALLAAATSEAEVAGLRVLRARGSELEQGFAFGAIRQLFETAVSSAPRAEREELLAGAAAPAAWVVAPSAGPDAAAAGSDAGFAALHGVYWLATNLSLAGPLALAVDDLHWVDRSSLRALAYLARRIGGLPIALVVAMRPDEPGAATELLDELQADPQAGRMSLRSLGRESVAAIVRESIPDADEALCSACFEASAGNPFYLRELLRTIAADSQASSAEAVREASVPAVGDRVVRRVARVGPEAAALARAMAALGDGGRLPEAAAVAGLDEDVAARAAGRLRRIEVLAREDPFAFVHPLVRRSVYDTLSVTERDAAHAAAAARLNAAGGLREAVAAHLAAVRPAGSASTAAALRDASGEALARAAPEAAIRWLRRALEEDAAEPPRAVLLHELGQVELFGRDPASVQHLQEALELAAEPVLRARIARDLGEILNAAVQWDAAIAVLSDGIRQLGDRDPELTVELETLAALMRAYHPRMVGDFDRDRDRLRQLAAGEGPAARALSILLAAIAANRADAIDEVRPLVEHGLRDGALFAGPGAGGWASGQALGALILVDADDRALEAADELEAHARRSGAVLARLPPSASGAGFIRGRATSPQRNPSCARRRRCCWTAGCCWSSPRACGSWRTACWSDHPSMTL